MATYSTPSAIRACSTPPFEEVIVDGENGYLIDFFDEDALANTVAHATKNPANLKIRRAARSAAVKRYDLKRICLPGYLSLLRDFTQTGVGSLSTEPGSSVTPRGATPNPEDHPAD